MNNAQEIDNYFIIKPDNRNINYDNYFNIGNEKYKTINSFSSDNTTLLEVQEIETLLLKVDEVKKEL